jgi:hypothetical protein
MESSIYVYVDSDHDDIQVFTTLEQAKIYTHEHWGNDEYDEWEELSNSLRYGEYVNIYKRQIGR